MVKKAPNIENVSKEAIEVLHDSLGRFGEFREAEWTADKHGRPSDEGYDFRQRFEITKGPGRGQKWWIHAEIKSIIHPKQAVSVIWQLKRSVKESVYPILIATHISESVAEICEEEGVGHLDLSGNCNIEFGGIWIERKGLPRKYKEVRSQKSLFSLKASRILRILLQGRLVSHKVEELAETADVSLGLVSKVRRLLLDEALAEESREGIRVTKPWKILDQWLDEDDFAKRTDIHEYSTLLSDHVLAESLRDYCDIHASPKIGGPVFTQNFAASLRAPHNVPTAVSAYLEELPNEQRLLKELKARPVSRGAGNLRIIVPSDFKGVTLGQHTSPEYPRIPIVSDLQLYLDLVGGERNGREQADVLKSLEEFNGGWK